MTFEQAVLFLAEVHTRDHWEVGFVVEMLPHPVATRGGEYVEAWRVVREHFHMQTEPPIAQEQP